MIRQFPNTLGCGPGTCRCGGCQTLGEVEPQKLIEAEELKKFVIYSVIGAIIGNIVSEYVMRRFVFAKNPAFVKTKKDEKIFKKAERMYKAAIRGGAEIDNKWAFINAKFHELKYGSE